MVFEQVLKVRARCSAAGFCCSAGHVQGQVAHVGVALAVDTASCVAGCAEGGDAVAVEV